MSNIVEISDFSGAYSIARDKFSEPKFEVIRDERQFELIYQMLGATLGALFIADLDANGVPQTARFTNIFNAFVLDDGCEVFESKGIKEMVKGYVYAMIVQDNNYRVAVGANVSASAENSNVNNMNLYLVKNYNKSIETAKSIQWYIGQNSSVYPEYSGKVLNYNSIY